MHKTKTILTLAACASLGLWEGLALAEEATGDRAPLPKMSETAAPFTKPDSSVTLGIGFWDGDRQKNGMFERVQQSETVGILDADINLRDDASGSWTILKARNLTAEDREAKIGYNKQGVWGVSLDYNEIPRHAPYTVLTKIIGLGSDKVTMPNPQSNGTGGDFHIGTDRERFNLEGFRFINKEWKFNLGLRYEKKEGTRHWGRGSAPEFMVEPIDWITRQADLSLSYLGKESQLTGGYNGSWFENAYSVVDVIRQGDNPATLANHTYLSTPLDNNAHQFFLQGAHSFTPTTRANFKLSHTRAKQNEHLGTANITGLAAAVAPTNLQGEVDTLLATVGLTAQPLPKLRLLANLRYNDVDDKTPPWLVVTGGTQVHSTPMSSETFSGKLEGTYRLTSGVSLTAGMEHKDQDRQIPFGNDTNNDGMDDERFVPFRSDLKETTYNIQVRNSLSDTLNGSLGYQYAVRDGSTLSQSVKILGNTQGKIAPFFIADRVRNKLRMAMDWNPMPDLDVQFVFENAHDAYDTEDEPFGRRRGEARLYSVDVDYAFTKKLLFTAWYSHDDNKMWQNSGRWDQTTPTIHEADKFSLLKDRGDSFGLGVRNQLNPDVKLGANYQWTETKSIYNTRVVTDPTNPGNDPAYPAGLNPLDSITSLSTKVNAFLEMANVGPGLLRFDYILEHWKTNDWTWQFNNGSPFIYGVNADGSKVLARPVQTSEFVGLRYTTKFQ